MVDNEDSTIKAMSSLLSSKDLVALGLYSSVNAAYLARVNGDSPDFIKLKRKVLYKRESVIEFIQRHTQRGDIHVASPSVILQNNKQTAADGGVSI